MLHDVGEWPALNPGKKELLTFIHESGVDLCLCQFI